QRMKCRDVIRPDRAVVTLSPRMDITALTAIAERAEDQDVFPVVDDAGALRGLVPVEMLRMTASHPELDRVAIVADIMGEPVSVSADQDLRVAASLLIAHDLRSIPVVDPVRGGIAGLLDEHDIAAAALGGRAA